METYTSLLKTHLPIFYVLRKNEKNLSNSVHLTSSFSRASVSNASLTVKVCENDGNN